MPELVSLTTTVTIFEDCYLGNRQAFPGQNRMGYRGGAMGKIETMR